jgi:hypothetical protein
MVPSVSAIAIGPGNQRCQFQENARYTRECEAGKDKCSLFSGRHDEDTEHRYLCMHVLCNNSKVHVFKLVGHDAL